MSYQYRIKKVPNEKCVFCGHDRNDADHTVLDCPRWERVRGKIRIEMGGRIEKHRIVNQALESREKWKAIMGSIERIIIEKEQGLRDVENRGQ